MCGDFVFSNDERYLSPTIGQVREGPVQSVLEESETHHNNDLSLKKTYIQITAQKNAYLPVPAKGFKLLFGGFQIDAAESELSPEPLYPYRSFRADAHVQVNGQVLDTVTIAVVPEIPRKDKLDDKPRNQPLSYNLLIAHPTRELAERLSLCLSNDCYLNNKMSSMS
ncbi:hypothetical protein pipiens_002641 [Culex pipiens pipiens]|uniref:Uncharacterized protein n=1 Tax=Culex pipiens pipiens TaxID=38569 RepID=A0ABD1DAN2_CULPP